MGSSKRDGIQPSSETTEGITQIILFKSFQHRNKSVRVSGYKEIKQHVLPATS